MGKVRLEVTRSWSGVFPKCRFKAASARTRAANAIYQRIVARLRVGGSMRTADSSLALCAQARLRAARNANVFRALTARLKVAEKRNHGKTQSLTKTTTGAKAPPNATRLTRPWKGRSSTVGHGLLVTRRVVNSFTRCELLHGLSILHALLIP
jgi:hypothetical protein